MTTKIRVGTNFRIQFNTFNGSFQMYVPYLIIIRNNKHNNIINTTAVWYLSFPTVRDRKVIVFHYGTTLWWKMFLFFPTSFQKRETSVLEIESLSKSTGQR